MGTTPSPIHFPNAGYQVLTSLIYFLGEEVGVSAIEVADHPIGLTIITHYISRRIQNESLTITGIKNMPRPRLWAILMFCESWLFLLSSKRSESRRFPLRQPSYIHSECRRNPDIWGRVAVLKGSLHGRNIPVYFLLRIFQAILLCLSW